MDFLLFLGKKWEILKIGTFNDKMEIFEVRGIGISVIEL